MHMNSDYTPPTALTVLSGIFLILGAICFLIVAGDIILRRGWRSMMGVMIPVYPINAAYMLPVSLYVYFKYGRAAKPVSTSSTSAGHLHHESNSASHCHSAVPEERKQSEAGTDSESTPVTENPHCGSRNATVDTTTNAPSHCGNTDSDAEKGELPATASMSHACHDTSSRPMWATVLVGVSHCGAGCVLGDLVGEWLVYGTGASINGASIWVELLVDYAFALLFGIAFQYFSIAPMSGEYGLKSVWRAAKADILSLTSFEVGAFGWMVIYQVGIFDYRLSMLTWTYWWMMQIGMAFGFATAMPVNYYLISKGIKEPCA